MAPEQALGQIAGIDRRTDVYGLAALLYEILTGVPPFPGRELAPVLHAVIHDAPLPPRERVAEVPVELEQICLQGLQKAREARQASVAVLAGQVHAWLEHFAARKRTEQERERFFDLSLDLLALVDQAGRFTQTNAAWETTLGWTPATRESAALRDFVVAEDQPILERALADLREGTQPSVGFEVRVESASGEPCWVHWSARRVPGETLVYLVGRDITERKLAEQEFRGLLESAPDAMIVTDRFGRIQLANRRVEAVFGHSRASLIGKPIDMLIPVHLRGAHGEHMRRFAGEPQFRMMGQGRQLTALHADGHEFAVDISLSPVEGREGPLVCVALRPRSEPG
jgi:serine/threonine-protein kinase